MRIIHVLADGSRVDSIAGHHVDVPEELLKHKESTSDQSVDKE